MIKKLVLTLALSVLCLTTVASASDVLDTWQPGVYFKMGFGGQAKNYEPHFGAQLSLTGTALDTLSGGNGLSQIKCAAKGECSNGFAGDLPVYMSVDLNPGRTFSAEWMGSSLYHYDYSKGTASMPMLNFLGPFNTADSWAMIITGSMVGAAGLGYGIAQWTSSRPTASAAPAEPPPPPPPPPPP